MKKAAIGTNDLGMHIVIRPISKALLSKDETVGIETQKINSLLTARRPIALADAISALPPLLPPSADPITGRRLYSIEEIMSGSCGIHFGPPVPELLRYETELSANTVLESSIASARSAAKQILSHGNDGIQARLDVIESRIERNIGSVQRHIEKLAVGQKEPLRVKRDKVLQIPRMNDSVSRTERER